MDYPRTLTEFIDRFSTEAACLISWLAFAGLMASAVRAVWDARPDLSEGEG
jgi:hypothetical protein